MWLYVLLIFGAVAAFAALAVTGLGLPIAIIGAGVLAGAVATVLLSRTTSAVEEADSESSKPSWMKRRWFE